MALWGIAVFTVLAVGREGVAETFTALLVDDNNVTVTGDVFVRISGNNNHVCDDVAESGRSSCRANWTFVKDSDGTPCLQIVNTAHNYFNANETCVRLGGNLLTIPSEKRQRIVEEFLPFRFSSNTWIGMRKLDTRYHWVGRTKTIPVTYVNSDESYLGYPSYAGSFCVALLGSGRKWKTYDCSSSFFFICESEQECTAGFLGSKCDQVCHCYGEPCKVGQSCRYGCEQGWMGPNCCTRKRKAEIIYYCVNSATDGRYLLVRINPFGVAYDRLQMLDENESAVPWCSGTHIFRDSAGIYSIVVSVSDENEEDMGFKCAGNKTGSNTFEWLISLEEKSGVVLPFDRRLQLSCDFDKADSMTRDQRQDFIRDSSKAYNNDPAVEKYDGSEEDVVLEVTDAFSGDPVSKARLGANVRLEMKLSVSADLMAKGVSPYRCAARSEDGAHSLQLTDDDGCATFIVSELKGLNGTAKSKIFQFFAIPGSDYITITCSFQFCFEPDNPLCTDRCSARRKHYTRRDVIHGLSKREISKPKTASTSVYVIREIGSQDAATSGQHGGGKMTSLTMGQVAWSLLVMLVCVSAALVFVIVAKERFRRRHRHPMQRQQASSLPEGLQSTDEQAEL